jgi:acylphosphatase
MIRSAFDTFIPCIQAVGRRSADVRPMYPLPMTQPTSSVRFEAVITGAVQGVGFRFSAARLAERLGLAGWVANATDGSVVVEAQGSPDDIAGFVAWLGKGPSGARVAHVELRWLDPVARATPFHIRSNRLR